MRVLFLSMVVLASGSLAAAEDVPGLVNEKPTSGRFVPTDKGFMVPYTATIPGTEVTFEMVPIPGGEFLLGSPDTEPGRNADEGPQVLVITRPFWMAKTEVSWGEYKPYMALHRIFKRFEEAKIRVVTEDNQIDAITAPTELYDLGTVFEFGDDPQMPAVMMTQYAARQYTKWLSGITGQQYRLPLEAEWEYAARAGSKGAYSFGNDPAELTKHARFSENSKQNGPRKVGQGKPNAFGLCDMHGNVAEWCLDEKFPAGYARPQERVPNNQALTVMETFAKPKTVYPRVVRGGSWESSAQECRSAARLGSDDAEWKDYDADLPKSPWWYTNDPTRGIGFRLLRSIDESPRDEMELFWSIDTDELRVDVAARVMGGRGVHGLVDKELPKAIETLKAKEKR